MANNEEPFTFDPTQFIRGLQQVTKQMMGMDKKGGSVAKNISRGMINAAAKIGLVTLAFKGIKAAIYEMPEIGQTFKIAKDVIFKNLLFPLRKAIFPLLQKFLDWVRDNRAMFVKWGHTLVNIFHSVGDMISGIIDTGKKIAKVFQGIIERTFGVQIKSFQELLNLLSFKMAVIFQFLGSLIEPLVDSLLPIIEPLLGLVKNMSKWVSDVVMSLIKMDEYGNNIFSVFKSVSGFFGDIVNFATQITDSFVQGFLPHITKLATPLKNIVDSFKSIFDSIFGSNEAMKNWESIFKFLGDTVGKVLVTAFQIIAKEIEIISTAIEKIVGFVKWIIDNASKISENIGLTGLLGDIGKGIGGIGQAGGEILKFLNPFDDVIITKRGQVVPVSPDDNIAAFKDNSNLLGGKGGNNISVSVDFTGMQIVLSESSPEAAQKVGESLVESFRIQMEKELERSGIK